ncbi:DUF3396 domain-containing protein [Corallococcus praedator]|uniref:DUF3396 domain-containing protein n=1 Tax=Corallococcus praedator TaxID=2316724 RepID=A0ABX9QBB9_9BACT|nr:DUF3396 domain-containing protein [Corallococcus sp. CA031C]RKH95990.1 DUF3396 domain-containing protein [Corallococcus praedator]
MGRDSLGWHSDSEGQWQQLDAAGWESTRRELQGSPATMVLMTDASTTDIRFHFEYLGRELGHPETIHGPNAVSALRVSFPTEFLETHGPGHVRELALEMARPLPISAGHAGLSFNGTPHASVVRDEVERLSLRHPAMDVLSLDGLSSRIGTRVRGPSWMNFLGQPVLGQLGGTEALRDRLTSPGTTVQDLGPDRAVVTLGPAPEAGDLEQGQTLPAYRELARVLEPWLYQTHSGPSSPDEVATVTRLRRWQRRFLD